MDLRPLRFLSLFAVFYWLAIVPASAQLNLDRIQTGIDQRREQLEELSRNIEAPNADLMTLRVEARNIRSEAEQATAPLRKERDRVRTSLDRLGKPPGEGEPQESPEVAAERQRLNREFALYDGALRQSDLNILEAGQIVEEINELRRDQFFDDLMARGPLPYLPEQLTGAGRTFGDGFAAFQAAALGWQAQKEQDSLWGVTLALLGAALLAALVLFLPLRRRADKLITRRIETVEPLGSRRVLVAAGRTLARVLPALLGGFILYQALSLTGAITAEGAAFARAVWFTFVAALLADGAATGIFAPKVPAWRVIPLRSSAVYQVRFLLVAALVILGLNFVLITGADLFATSASLLLLVQSAVTILLAVTLLLLCRPSLWKLDAVDTEEQQKWGGKTWSRLRLAGQVVALVSLAAILTGYVPFGHYLMTRMFGLIGLGSVIWLLRALLREGIRLFDKKFTSSRKSGQPDDNFVFFWIGASIDIIALLAFFPPALLILGAEAADVRNGIVDAFTGFRIGAVEISLAKILSALILFLGLLYLTRQVQKTAETRFFPKSRIDIGVQNSLKTLIGYVGLVIAFAIGVGTLGFDLSNLAIIAGALSVGIGFGLQSIVNNFVSGLILLFERPIKVGDWIVTSSGEGVVKRISVRSTEIETFDRSSVIVPNSELISSAVTNWTHKDSIARVIVPIGVTYKADPEQVIKLMSEVTHEHPKILDEPKPFVFFKDFGESSLDFEVRGFISQVRETFLVRSELRILIFKKLKEAGIEIPFPQRDLHIIPPDSSGETLSGQAGPEQHSSLPPNAGN